MSEGETALQKPKPATGIAFTVSASKMRVTVDVDVEHAKDWSPDRVHQYLTSERVVYGIDEQAIRDIFTKKIFNQTVVVAKGTPPAKGRDGTVRYHIDLDCLRGRPRVLGRTDRVNHRDLGMFQAVKEGDLLAEREPPTAGFPGRDVYGNEIPAPQPKEAKLTGGKNTKVSEDGNCLVATVEGCLTGTPEKIDVVPALAISGDIDYKTGNIASKVAVTVGGGVLPGFSIKSDEDVHIRGVVDAAEIASAGRIAVKGGIQGGRRAVLTAGKDIITRFANEATLKAKGNIVVQGPVTHCHIETEGHFISEGGKGIILGGQVHANYGVTADAIGSDLGIETLITVGAHVNELIERISELEEKRGTVRANAAKVGELARVLAGVKAGAQTHSPGYSTSSPHKQAKVLAPKIKKTLLVLGTQIKEIDAQLQILAARREREARVYRTVNIKDTLWPGTHIRILDNTFVPTAPMTRCTLTIIDHKIQAFPYRQRPLLNDVKKQNRTLNKS